jgi:hypothetical protein
VVIDGQATVLVPARSQAKPANSDSVPELRAATGD